MQRRRSRDPQDRDRSPSRRRPLCGYCKKVKVRVWRHNDGPDLVMPLCTNCWLELGKPDDKKAAKLIAAKNEQRRKLVDGADAPW